MLAWKTFRIFSLEGLFISELCPNLRGMFGDLLGMRFSLQMRFYLPIPIKPMLFSKP